MKPTLKRSIDFKLPMGILSVAKHERQLYLACMDGVYRAHLDDRTHERIDQHESYVSGVAVFPESSQLVTSGYDGAIHWNDLETSERTRRLKVHDFWSWDLAVSPDKTLLASVTGQYLAGGYKYEPQAQREACVKLISVASGEVLHELPHVPSVQAVAFSPDNQFVAAGNLMGDIRVWDCRSGELISQWNTPDFTSWGVIKSHCYLGGIFAMQFTPDSNDILLAGMGPMHDPMAGNGRQLWQRWAWRETPPRKVDETHQDQAGEGLMETLAIHPQHPLFAIGGRLRGGQWNVGLFDLQSGDRIAELKTGYRVTQAVFIDEGAALLLVGMQGQGEPDKEGKIADFGRVEVYDIEMA